MNFELRKYNIEQVKRVFQDVQGKSVMVNDTSLFGVKSIDIDIEEMFDGDPILEENYDGGRTEYIRLTFNFEGGTVVHSFCPEREACEIMFETDELWIIRIEDSKKYIENKMCFLESRLKDYEEYMSR